MLPKNKKNVQCSFSSHFEFWWHFPWFCPLCWMLVMSIKIIFSYVFMYLFFVSFFSLWFLRLFFLMHKRKENTLCRYIFCMLFLWVMEMLSCGLWPEECFHMSESEWNGCLMTFSFIDDSIIPPSSRILSGFLNVNTKSLRDISAGKSLLIHNKTLMLVLGM